MPQSLLNLVAQTAVNLIVSSLDHRLLFISLPSEKGETASWEYEHFPTWHS